MKRSIRAFLLALCLPGLAAASAPVTVSPGSVSAETTVNDRCPSFSWSAVAGAGGYELAVYGIDAAGQVEPEPVVLQRIAGMALSWTPDANHCLEPGGRYAWSVRALGQKAAGEWSAPSLFSVASGPGEEEFRAALEVVRRYLAGRGDLEAEVALDPPPAAQKIAPVTGSKGEPPAAPLASAPADEVGLLAEMVDQGDRAFGVYGRSAAEEIGSAGIVGETTAAVATETYGVIGRHTGGVGSLGAAGAFVSLGSADVLRGLSDGFEVLKVDTSGNLSLPFGDLACSSCIHGTDIAFGTITGSDIATGTITGSDIATNSIGETDLAPGSVGADEVDTIFVVSVDCNGTCNDVMLGDVCAASGESTRRPLAVDCTNVDNDSGSPCPGTSGAECASFIMGSGSSLGAFCDDGSGTDAQVYCLDDDD